MSDEHARPGNFPWPPLVFVAAIALSVLLDFLYRLPWFASPLADILFAAGWLLVVAGVALITSALRALHRANTTAAPHRPASHLVTSGAFALSRNPIYLANTLVMVGIGLIAGMTWFVPLALAAALLTQKLAVEPEERHLEARFGKKYRDYAKKVRRWL